MAITDKVYGTEQQLEELRAHLSTAYQYALRYLYEWVWDDDREHPIASFSERVDDWLIKRINHIPLRWLVDQLNAQYGLDQPWRYPRRAREFGRGLRPRYKKGVRR